MILGVYGSLRRFHHNNRVLGEEATFLRESRLPDYGLYRVNWFPGIRPCIGSSVLLELYDVPKRNIDAIDRYEGFIHKDVEHSLFVRKAVLDEHGLPIQVYVYNGHVTGCNKIESGDWADAVRSEAA